MKNPAFKRLALMLSLMMIGLVAGTQLHAQNLVGSQPITIWNYHPANFVNVRVKLMGPNGSATFSTWVCPYCAWIIGPPEFAAAGGTGVNDLEMFVYVAGINLNPCSAPTQPELTPQNVFTNCTPPARIGPPGLFVSNMTWLSTTSIGIY